MFAGHIVEIIVHVGSVFRSKFVAKPPQINLNFSKQPHVLASIAACQTRIPQLRKQLKRRRGVFVCGSYNSTLSSRPGQFFLFLVFLQAARNLHYFISNQKRENATFASTGTCSPGSVVRSCKTIQKARWVSLIGSYSSIARRCRGTVHIFSSEKDKRVALLPN